MRSNSQLVAYITKQLESHGIDVNIQPAVTTNSFYLRLDNGALKNLRVGDHPGKAKYNFTYEIGKHIPKAVEIRKSFKGSSYSQFRFPADEVDDLINVIRVARTNIKLKYGEANYAIWSAP